jgi:hypothetical protein
VGEPNKIESQEKSFVFIIVQYVPGHTSPPHNSIHTGR